MKIQVKLTEEGQLNVWGSVAPYTCIIDVEINEEQKQILKERLSKGLPYYLSIGETWKHIIDVAKLTEKSLDEL